MKQLITFFSLAYCISWLTWLPLYGHVIGLTGLHTLRFNHAFGALGPMAASFISTFLFYKWSGVKQLLKSCFSLKPLVYLFVSLAVPFTVVFIAAAINSLLNKAPLSLAGIFTNNEFPGFSFPAFFAYNLVFFGLGEEAGWRGFALPRLQRKFNALVSSILLTVPWALWHLPLFFYRPGYTSMDIAAIAGWFLSLLTGSILLTWLFNSSKASILVCAVFHSAIDIVFTAGIADKNVISYAGMVITICGALAIIVFKPANLAPVERAKSL